MTPSRVVTGYLESVAERGKRTCLMIYVKQEEAEQLFAELGFRPERGRQAAPIALAAGRAAEALAHIREEVRSRLGAALAPAGLAPPRKRDLAGGIALVAMLATTRQRLDELVTHEPGQSDLYRDLVEATDRLKAAKDDLNAEFAAVLAERGAS